MPQLTVRFRGDTSKLDILDRLFRKEVSDTLRAIAEETRDDVKANWSSSSPSAPGAPPAVVTGALDASVQTDQQRGSIFEKPYTAVVVEEPYGVYLEEGTGIISPRPFLAPAAGRAARRMNTSFQIVIR